MSIEPDAPLIHKLIPWLERSKIRFAIFGVLLITTGIVIFQIWFTHFFLLYTFVSAIIAIFWIFLTLMLSEGDKDNEIQK